MTEHEYTHAALEDDRRDLATMHLLATTLRDALAGLNLNHSRAKTAAAEAQQIIADMLHDTCNMGLDGVNEALVEIDGEEEALQDRLEISMTEYRYGVGR